MSRSPTATSPSWTSLGCTNRMSSIRSSERSSTAHTRPSKSLLVTSRYLSAMPSVSPLAAAPPHVSCRGLVPPHVGYLGRARPADDRPFGGRRRGGWVGRLGGPARRAGAGPASAAALDLARPLLLA